MNKELYWHFKPEGIQGHSTELVNIQNEPVWQDNIRIPKEWIRFPFHKSFDWTG